MKVGETWPPEERSARVLSINEAEFTAEERIVEQYVDPVKKGRTFSIYYFVKDLTHQNSRKPTILFAAGGPGQIVQCDPDDFNWLDIERYRVVYFHIRGSGFSQLPAGVEFDRYIRTAFIVDDIEKIRQDVLGNEPWAAIIGNSYGTVAAQGYAKKYGRRRVRKLVLSACFTPVCALRGSKTEGAPDEPQILESLREIYQNPDFDVLPPKVPGDKLKNTRNYIVARVAEALTEVDKMFWNVQYVGDNYSRLAKTLKKKNLDLGAAFFRAIRRIRHTGWLGLDEPLTKDERAKSVKSHQIRCALVIAAAILRKAKRPLKPTTTVKIKSRAGTESPTLQSIEREFEEKQRDTQSTTRTYYLINICDGLSVKFLRNLKEEPEVAKAIGKSRGTSGDNPFLKKLEMLIDEPIKPWDPADYKHRVPTLILKGGADPINDLGEAEHFYNQGLKGEGALIEFPGIGHSMALPEAGKNAKFVVRIDGRKEEKELTTRETLIDAFLRNKFSVFKRAPILKAVRKRFSVLLRARAGGATGRGIGNPKNPKALAVNVVFRG